MSTRRFHLGRRTLIVIAAIVAGIGLCGGIAWAYWTSQATGVPAYAAADAIGTSATPTATANGNAVQLTWPATTTGSGRAVTGYQVARYAAASGGTAVTISQGSCAASPVTTTGCTETGVPAGTWYYTITPMLSAWRGIESGRGMVAVAQDSFALSWSGSPLTAGTSANLTITAQSGSTTDTAYSGAKTLAYSGPGIAPNGTAPRYTSAVTFSNGVATVPVTLYRAESTTLTVADGAITGSLATTVNPAAAGQLSLPTPSSQVAGTSFTVTVTALDSYGNTATAYTGGKTLTWSGPGTAPNGTAPLYTSAVTFTNGVATVPVTLYLAQNTTLTATDGSIHGTSGTFTVAPGAASRFGVTTGSTQTAGTAFSVTVTAQDAYQNTATSYSGTKTLNWTGPSAAPDGTQPTKTSSVTFTSGVATASVTLFKAETTTLGATTGTISGTSANITVIASAPKKLAWTQLSAPSAKSISSPCLFTCSVNGFGNGNGNSLTAYVSVTDTYGNIVTGLSSGLTVTLTTNGGSLSPNPNNDGSLTLTIASGAATSGQFTFTGQNGNWTDTLTAAATGYSSATATVTK